jgi:DNA repair exonuclease SbcCD ATPase subunit
VNYEQLEHEFEQAVANFEALKREQAELPATFNAAALTGDAGALMSLTQRQGELLTLIFASEVTQLRAHASLLDAQLAELRVAQVPLIAAVKQAETTLEEAKAKAAAAWRANGKLDARMSTLNTKKQTLLREINERIAARTQADLRRPVYSLQHVSTR